MLALMITTSATRRIRVLLADDHPAVALGLERLLADQPDMELVGSARDALGALALPFADVAVVDYQLGRHNGLWLTRRLKQRRPSPRVLLYSAFSDDVLAIAATIAGADGVLRKSAVGEELCLAVRHLADGGRYLPLVSPTVARAVGSRVAAGDRQIFHLLVHGRSAASVAAQLGIPETDVDEARRAALDRIAPAPSRADRPLGPVTRMRPSATTPRGVR